MKLLLIAALAILASVHAAEEAVVPESDQYMYFPDGNGNLHMIDLNESYEPMDPELERANLNTITFNLYTRNNRHNPQVLFLHGISTVTNSNFNRNRATRFVTHGWRSSQWSESCTSVRDAFLNAGDYNVIVVDWSSIASIVYSAAAGNVRNVAGRVSEFLNFLQSQAGLNFGSTWVIGHSLGGHVAGIAARGAHGNIQAVVALDPAQPSFENAGAGSGVHPSDANHVQVIHTNGGLLGLQRAAGDSDFYPNGGRSQPGCGIDVAGTCAHSRAYLFFAESIGRPTAFRATNANNVFMGSRNLSWNARGSFQLTTNDRAPFGRG